MIWHFLEVWALLAILFAAGCVLGAWLYGVIGASALAGTQGLIADAVGDAIDRIKVRLGVGPAWRHDQLVTVGRPVPEPAGTVAPEDRVEPTLAPELPAIPAPPPEVSRPEAAETAEEVPVEGDPAREAGVGHVADDGVVPKRPAGLSAPRGGVPDNLTRIRGIGARNEALLNSLGIYHFGQIASWTPGEMRWIGQYLAFPERIERDDWIGQAIALASGTETGFTKSADRRRQRRRQKQLAYVARQQALLEDETSGQEMLPPPDEAYGSEEMASRGDELEAALAEQRGEAGDDAASPGEEEPFPDEEDEDENDVGEDGGRGA